MNTKLPTKVGLNLAVGLLTLAILLSSFGVAASLDELARIPFPHTLVVLALLFDLAAAVSFWGRVKNQVDAGVHSRIGDSPHGGSLFGLGKKVADATETGCYETQGTKCAQAISPEEIQWALRKVHSVAWGFPRPKPRRKQHAGKEYAREGACEQV